MAMKLAMATMMVTMAMTFLCALSIYFFTMMARVIIVTTTVLCIIKMVTIDIIIDPM